MRSAVTIRALCDVGDEVIYLSPPWFFYELMIASAGATRRARRPRRAPTFDLDVDAIAAAITPRTRAIIVNTPHNPTGRIYREPELRALGDVLRAASERHGRPIVLSPTSRTTGSSSTASSSAARRSTTTRPR